jgi:hypothetical protein
MKEQEPLTLPWGCRYSASSPQLNKYKVLKEVTFLMNWKMLLLRILELKPKHSKFLR